MTYKRKTFLAELSRSDAAGETAVEKALWFYCSVQEIVRSSISMSYPEDAERGVSASNSIRAVGMTKRSLDRARSRSNELSLQTFLEAVDWSTAVE